MERTPQMNAAHTTFVCRHITAAAAAAADRPHCRRRLRCTHTLRVTRCRGTLQVLVPLPGPLPTTRQLLERSKQWPQAGGEARSAQRRRTSRDSSTHSTPATSV